MWVETKFFSKFRAYIFFRFYAVEGVATVRAWTFDAADGWSRFRSSP